jgi:hypothetical protein
VNVVLNVAAAALCLHRQRVLAARLGRLVKSKYKGNYDLEWGVR